MRTIYKYPLAVTDEQILTLKGKVLSAGVQDGILMVWATHNDNALECKVRISVRGTGHQLGDVALGDFVGTVFMGPLVWHVFAEHGLVGA